MGLSLLTNPIWKAHLHSEFVSVMKKNGIFVF